MKLVLCLLTYCCSTLMDSYINKNNTQTGQHIKNKKIEGKKTLYVERNPIQLTKKPELKTERHNNEYFSQHSFLLL
jgi:spore maturation protein CgeB